MLDSIAGRCKHRQRAQRVRREIGKTEQKNLQSNRRAESMFRYERIQRFDSKSRVSARRFSREVVRSVQTNCPGVRGHEFKQVPQRSISKGGRRRSARYRGARRSSSHANFCSLQIRYENGRDARSRREFVRQTGQPLDSNDLVKIGAVTVGSSLIKGKKYYSNFIVQHNSLKARQNISVD